MDDVERAEEFATLMHSGQLDRAGAPYIEHPRAVAAKVEGKTEKIVAWLHDTVEDTDATIEQIESLFGDEVARAVALLTHDKRDSYMDYVRKIKGNEIARKVKMADLSHNMDVSRLPIITDADWGRVKKYKRAYDLLKED